MSTSLAVCVCVLVHFLSRCAPPRSLPNSNAEMPKKPSGGLQVHLRVCQSVVGRCDAYSERQMTLFLRIAKRSNGAYLLTLTLPMTHPLLNHDFFAPCPCCNVTDLCYFLIRKHDLGFVLTAEVR